MISVNEEALQRRLTSGGTYIGYHVVGFHFVVLYLYFKIQTYIQKFTLRKFFVAMVLVIFIFLFQTGSTTILVGKGQVHHKKTG